jgi:hypothetical protein
MAERSRQLLIIRANRPDKRPKIKLSLRYPDGHFKIPHLWPPKNPPPMNQNLAMDDKEAPEGTILFSSSSLLSDTRGGGKISGHKWGKLGGRPGVTAVIPFFGI